MYCFVHSMRRLLGIVVLALLSLMVLVALVARFFVCSHESLRERKCKSNLKAAATAASIYFSETGCYSSRIDQIDFLPERGNRYAYFLDETGSVQDRSGQEIMNHGHDTAVGPDLYKYGPNQQVSRDQLPRRLAGGVLLGTTESCQPSATPRAPNPGYSMTIACIGQLDDDPTLDVWSISTAPRQLPSGQEIPAMVPYNEIQDRVPR